MILVGEIIVLNSRCTLLENDRFDAERLTQVPRVREVWCSNIFERCKWFATTSTSIVFLG